MARTKIDWCDAVWNPVWGCNHSCSFCYARKFAGRFYRTVAKANGLSPEEAERLKNFAPIFLPKNFERKFSRRERIIFVNSMSDVNFWEQSWIEKTLKRIEGETERVFLFLTKAPESYSRFPRLPENVWLGVSATTNLDFQKRTKKLLDSAPTENLFVSLEPLLEELDEVSLLGLGHYRWVIVGPQTGSLNRSLREKYQFFRLWIQGIKCYCCARGIPLFTKEACKKYGVKLIREFPF